MTTEPDLDAAFDRAAAALRAGDADTAAEDCALLLRHAPDHPAALNLTGLVRLRQRADDEAIDLFRRAAQAAPNDASIHRNLGRALLQAGHPVDAAAAYETAVSLAPGDIAAIADLAAAHEAAGMPNRAEDTYRRILKLQPGHRPASVALARLRGARGDSDGAISALSLAVEHAMDDAALLLALAHALRRAGRLGEAVSRYAAAVALEPDNADSRAALAHVLGEQGGLKEAVAVYRDSLALDPEQAGVWSNLGWTLAELKRHKAAIEACDRAIALDADLPAAHYHLALARRGLRDVAGAAQALERVLALAPRHVRALALLGAVREEMGETDEARRIFDMETMIARRSLAAPAGFDDLAAFNRALADSVQNHPSLMWNRPARSTVAGSQTLDIARDSSPAVTAFRAEAEAAVRDYLAARAAAASPGTFFHDPPPAWDIVIWGVVLKESGHQFAHNHPSGIVSGVYYPVLPPSIGAGADSRAGYLRFSSASGRNEIPRLEVNRMGTYIRPEEGLMVLFPSYFWHSTVPFDGLEPRISVAFDAVPRG